MMQPNSERTRLDKWLWAARFFKTRSLATEAIGGGKIQVNGLRAKPSREVHIGDEIYVRKDMQEWTVVVEKLTTQRRCATEAQQMYVETEASIAKREQAKLEPPVAARARGTGRPTKRERRDIYKLKQL
jgi:ribosome-associated heat shock protein Hsp15